MYTLVKPLYTSFMEINIYVYNQKVFVMINAHVFNLLIKYLIEV